MIRVRSGDAGSDRMKISAPLKKDEKGTKILHEKGTNRVRKEYEIYGKGTTTVRL